MNGWLVTLALVAAYVTFVVWLIQTGRLRRWNLSLMLGIILMVRTQRGKGALEVLARPKRLWNVLGDFGILLTLTGMLLMTLLFLWSVWFALQPDSGVQPLGASEILVIPGVNPFVPLWYGILALILTLVVHEGGHGILARANNMRVKSLGLLFAVVPIGAFVEPDEEDLNSSTRRNRLRVFAAGPLLNLIFAALFLGLFVGGMNAAALTPGVPIAQVVVDAPAQLAGIGPGDVIVAADGEPMRDWAQFNMTLAAKRPGDELALTLRDGRQVTAVLHSRWEHYPEELRQRMMATDEAAAVRAMEEDAYLGVYPFRQDNVAFAQQPFGGDCDGTGARRPFCEMAGFLTLIALPVGEVRGAPYLSTYFPMFLETPFDGDVFWPLVTLAFWMFWINLMVGLTNILPMLPLDGGHIFRDAVGGAAAKAAPNASEEKRMRFVNRAAVTVSFLILGAFLLQIFGPRLVQ